MGFEPNICSLRGNYTSLYTMRTWICFALYWLVIKTSNGNKVLVFLAGLSPLRLYPWRRTNDRLLLLFLKWLEQIYPSAVSTKLVRMDLHHCLRASHYWHFPTKLLTTTSSYYSGEVSRLIDRNVLGDQPHILLTLLESFALSTSYKQVLLSTALPIKLPAPMRTGWESNP